MVIFAGSLSIQLSIELRSRNLLIPWVKKASTISCSRAYQSSDVVRYIHRISKSKEGGNFSHLFSDSRTSLKDTTTQRSWILDDGAQYQFSCAKRISDVESEFSEDVTNQHLGIEDEGFSEVFGRPNGEFKIFNENDASEMDATSVSTTKQDVKTMAIEVLATRALTTFQLRKKLCGMKFPPHEVEAVIADFQGRGLLNDYLYAETFSRSRWFSLSWGPRRIKLALLQKGVSEADAEKAMEQVFQDGDSSADQDTHLGMSKISTDRLFAQASKQWLRGRDVSLETRKSRIVRWLQYRGFNWRVTNFVLKKLESQYPP